MYMFIGILIVVALFAAVLYFFSREFKKENQEEKVYLPDDGYIYDPVSGRKLTLEEAESGVVVSEDMASVSSSRIKTDEEIETFYTGDVKLKEYIKRELMVSGAGFMGRDLLDWLDQSVMLQGLVSFNLDFMFQVVPGRYLGMASVTYRMPGHSGSAGSEYQFVGFIAGINTIQHQDILKDLEIELLAHGLLLRLPRMATRTDFDRLVVLIRDASFTGA
jgi:hypothetical protein